MSALILGKSGIIGVSYQETSLLKNSLVKARERNNNAIKSINSGKNNLNISGNSRRIIIEEDNLQRCYNKLRENNNKIEKAINDIDYVVRKVKEVDKKCANRIKTIGTSYKVKSSISSVKNNLISLGDKVLSFKSSFIKEGIDIFNSKYDSKKLQAIIGVVVNVALTSSPNIASIKISEKIYSQVKKDGLIKPIKQAFLGEFTKEEDRTLTGTVAEIAIGFTPVGVFQDVRDFSSYVIDWKWSWKHTGLTALAALAIIPGVSEFKKIFKGLDDVADVTKGTSKVIKNIDNIEELKHIDKIDEVSDTLKNGIKNSEDVIKTIHENDRIKIYNWDYTPKDDLYLKYKDVYDDPKYYDQSTGNIHWPIDDGFKAGTKTNNIVNEGTIFKRYGEISGEFLGNAKDPFESRALAPHSEGSSIHYYQLAEDYEMTVGKAAPWFGSEGGADQFVKYKPDGSKYTIKELLEAGILEDITDLVESGEIKID